MSGQRTEKPTPKKIKDSRKQGKVAYSSDFTAAFLFTAGVFVMAVLCAEALHHWVCLLKSLWRPSYFIVLDSRALNCSEMLAVVLKVSAQVLVPVFAVGGILAYLQIGPLWVPVRFDATRISPVKGLKNMISRRKCMDFVRLVLKLAVVAACFFFWIKNNAFAIGALNGWEPSICAVRAGHMLLRVGLVFCLTSLVFGVVDRCIQRKRYTRDLMMTRSEVERERKEVEGDAELHSRRREQHRRSMSEPVAQRVAASTMVVVNPTHFAVALEYRWDGGSAPRVAARGSFEAAQRIREIARAHGVPVIRHPPLARQLFLLMEDEEIPEVMFRAVAELLVYLMRMSVQERERCR